MDINKNLGHFVRIMIFYSILSQLYFMIKKRTNRILASSFYIWGIASLIMSYVYYKEDDMEFTFRVYFKIITSILLILIGYYSL